MKKPLKDPAKMKEVRSIFSRATRGTLNWFKQSNGPTVKYIKTKWMVPQKPFMINDATKLVKAHRNLRVVRGVGRGGLRLGIGVGAIAMIGLGVIKGMGNASREIVAQRQMQDQRYARNITMMSRLGYTTGTSSMNRYNHTVGLSQALSANRHGRGGY
jgi:hypothetical protein